MLSSEMFGAGREKQLLCHCLPGSFWPVFLATPLISQCSSPSAVQLSSPEPEGFFLSSPSSSSEPDEMVWMSSLSLVVPWACPATVCPFSPSLSVLLDRVSTSCKKALASHECSLGREEHWSNAFQATFKAPFSPNSILLFYSIL